MHPALEVGNQASEAYGSYAAGNRIFPHTGPSPVILAVADYPGDDGKLGAIARYPRGPVKRGPVKRGPIQQT